MKNPKRDPSAGLRLLVRGIVQGVGFRPFVHRLAVELELAGRVWNNSRGVLIEIEGPAPALEAFLQGLELDRPPAAVITSIEATPMPLTGAQTFSIEQSEGEGDPSARLSPDLAVCEACLEELFDPSDRRYRYPFLNCTQCGPRYSIVERIPYDRGNTTMRRFEMCAPCRAEYEDPSNRRFHAQPNACPACGPHLELWDTSGAVLVSHDDALRRAAAAVREGAVVAVKGLGGFHLLVDARNVEAVHELRRRKHRDEKPFALMFGALEQVAALCEVSPIEAAVLRSAAAPILLLRRRSFPDQAAAPGLEVAEAVAPGNPTLGVMLPYTPLHRLLLLELGFPAVATSGNRSDEPICTDEREALSRLRGIADLFLVHDRPIARPIDDPVARVFRGDVQVLRAARGYAPLYLELSRPVPPTLAVGAHLKCAVAVTVGRELVLGPHIGDLETVQAVGAFERAVEQLEALHGVAPARVACDAHPDYHSTRYARRLGLPVTGVQHHEAHVRACMLEAGLEGAVLGVAWDGTGYGPDGTVWGGEFLRVDGARVDRVAHFRPFPLPGGERAVREPRRSALGLLYALLGERVLELEALPTLQAFTDGERRVLMEMMRRNLQAPLTSSAGRLFDAVASMLGLHQKCSFEGQAAMALEFLVKDRCDSPISCYPLEVDEDDRIDWSPMVQVFLDDLERNVPAAGIAARFHQTLAELIAGVARRVGLERVVLTGGCFQNRILLEWTVRRLEARGLRPHWPRRIPLNDGGIAAGQLASSLISAADL